MKRGWKYGLCGVGGIAILGIVFIYSNSYFEGRCLTSAHDNYETDVQTLKSDYGTDGVSIDPPRYAFNFVPSRCVYEYEYFTTGGIALDETLIKDGFTNDKIGDFLRTGSLGSSPNDYQTLRQQEIKLFGSNY